MREGRITQQVDAHAVDEDKLSTMIV